jgi:hypothetical protein
MKKFLAKLGLFVTINLILISVLPVANAACDIAAIAAALKDDDCITQDAAGKTFVSIIEEPMENSEVTGIDGFTRATCYRKTVSCQTEEEKPQTLRNASLVNATTGCTPGTTDDLTTTCKEVTVIFSNGGTVMISGYVGMIYRWAAPIVGMICVLVIVVSGLQLSFSAGDSGVVDAARKRIVQSLSGLAVLFLSSVILYTVNPNFFTAAIK